MSFHLLCLNTLQVLRQEFPSQPSKFYSLVDLQCKYDLSEVFFFFTPPGISHSAILPQNLDHIYITPPMKYILIIFYVFLLYVKYELLRARMVCFIHPYSPTTESSEFLLMNCLMN